MSTLLLIAYSIFFLRGFFFMSSIPLLILFLLYLLEQMSYVYNSCVASFLENSIICVILRSVSVDLFFFWLWIIFSCFSMCLIIFYWMLDILNVTLLVTGFCYIFIIYLFIYFLLYSTVLVLPYIDMNPPQVYMSSQSWTPSHLPPHIISQNVFYVMQTSYLECS